MNFEATLTDSNPSNSSPPDFISNNNQSIPNSNDKVKNIVNLNPNSNNGSVIDSSLGLQSKSNPQDDLLFRARSISHSNHRPHPQALRELSAIVNEMDLNNGINRTLGLGNNTLGLKNEEYNLFNNRSFSGPNLSISSNNSWGTLKWNNFNNNNSNNQGPVSGSFGIINKNINNNTNNNTNILVNNSNTGINTDNSSSNNSNNNSIPDDNENNNEQKNITPSTNSTTLTTASLSTTVDPSKITSTSSILNATTTTMPTQEISLSELDKNVTSTSTTSTSSLHVPLFKSNSKSFSPLINDNTNQDESNGLIHSDSDITLINNHVVSRSGSININNAINGNLTSPSGININTQTPLINQFSKLSMDVSNMTKSSPSSNIYNNLFFNNESEQNNMFNGSPINNQGTSQIIRHNSLPVSSNPSLLISSERENELSHLKNDIDLLIRSSQLKFDDLIKYKDKLSSPNISDEVLNHIKKELLIQGWYQHAYYSIRKIKDRLQEIFKLSPSVWMVDIDIFIAGDIDITLYYFKLHIHTCYDLKSCIVSEWRSNHYTEITNWWASASLLFNQILLLFKLSENTIIKPLTTTKIYVDEKPSIHDNEIRSSKSVDENIFSKKMQTIGRKGSLLSHGLNPHSSNLSNLNSSSNITSPLATSSTVVDTEDVENLNEELILGESVLSTNLTSSNNSNVISSSVPTTIPTLPVISANSNIKFPYPGTNIYIRGLPITTTDESLYNLCIRWGKIISSKAIVDMRTNECKGFGFVMYETEDQAHTALSELNNLGYHVSFAKSLTHASQESYSSKLKNLEDLTSMNIYISNLPLDYDNEKLLELFGNFKVLSHRILKNPDGTSRGVGFARFGSREIAQHVIDLFNNKTLKGAKYPLQVRFADSIAQKKLKNQVATSRKRKDSIREQHSPSFSNNYKKLDDFDVTSTTKSESEFELDKTQNSQKV
ncbi:hypothetical protein H8356DRAFT_598730 [Neocallimastix lanati (nom. inval.)]|jgi:RNA recognition motif-containing protein|nr:hypothetical protein H8356DRAFT_598730 [Neocallimastix sp. JGI-2020a]